MTTHDHAAPAAMNPPIAPIRRYVALPTGLTYHLLEWPHPTSRTTIVLVHGFLDLAWGWKWVAQELARHYHVVAPDLRGHGDTDWIGPGGYYHFFDYLPDLDEVIRRTARDRLIIAGHSMGGSVVSYWAGSRAGHAGTKQPAALALLEGLGPPEGPDTAATRLGSWIDQWHRVRRAPVKPMVSLDDAIARLRHHDDRLGLEMARELAEQGTRPASITFGLGAGARAGAGGGAGADPSGHAGAPGGHRRLVWKHDPLHVTAGALPFRRELAMSLWARVTCPVLLIEARQSTFRLAAEDAAFRRAAFARVRDAVVEDAGHMMLRHQPVEVARLLAELAESAPQ
jgi:pimeloyl-ACP methyl ester carboxylesterase